MKTLSVVIPNLDSPLIAEVIAALQGQTARDHIVEIIVVGLDRLGLVPTNDLVQFVDTRRPIPAGTARNIGAAAALGEYVLFLDADCLLMPDAVSWLLQACHQYDAVIGGVMLKQSRYWELCSNMLTFPYNTEFDAPGPRTSLASFCMIMSRQVWAAANGFDETYTIACEDMDLSMRLRRAGFRLGCEPRARIAHRSRRTSFLACYHNHRTYGWFWRKIRRVHADMLPPAPTLQAVAEHGAAGSALGVFLALVFVARLIGMRRPLWRFWYALPGLVLLRLAFYDGYRQSAAAATQP